MEPTFWEEYKWWIIGFISLCATQTLLIAALSLQRARRKRTEVALAEKELRLREAQTIARLGSFHWDVSGEGLSGQMNSTASTALNPPNRASCTKPTSSRFTLRTGSRSAGP